MIITAIIQAVRDPERINLSLDGEFAAGLEKNTLVEFSLFVGKEISEQQFHEIITADLGRYLLRRARGIWFRKPIAQSDLRPKLMKLLNARRGIETISKEELQDIFESVFAKLAEANFGDRQYAFWFVEQRAHQAKYGKQRVLSELAAKRIARDIAKEAVAQFFPDETEARDAVLLKKFGVTELKEISDIKERARAYRYLASRGFRIGN